MLALCPNIILVFEVYQSESQIALLLEYKKGGTLRNYVKNSWSLISEDKIRSIATQLLLTADFMHRKNIVHRDLKPENILLESTQAYSQINISIADLGLATEIKDIDSKLVCGTPGFMAPEVILGKRCDEKSDIFAIGLILYYCINRSTLFVGVTGEQVFKDTLQSNYEIRVN